MESWPRDSSTPKGKTTAKPPSKDDPCVLVGGPDCPIPQFKIFDFGTAVVYPDVHAVKRPRAGEKKPRAAAELEEKAKEKISGKPGIVPEQAADLEGGYNYSKPYFFVSWGGGRGRGKGRRGGIITLNPTSL